MTQSETRRFGMHPQLLFDVILKQAGTLAKGILEGVMNSLDAGATRCAIHLDSSSLTIEDDGRGFASRDEIERFFEVFGTPHQENDARLGRFRMGRGQLFAFGVNRWRSNEFGMTVDIKGRGLDYDLETSLEKHSGCRVEVALYETLLPSERDHAAREIKDYVAFSEIPVTLNGDSVSLYPAKQKWTEETEDAWIRLAPAKATLDIYNLGFLVRRYPAFHYGAGGIVVSKKRLDVNFARNDIQSTCRVWRRIAKHIQREQTGQIVKKPRLTDAERQNLAEQFIAGDLSPNDVPNLKLLTDITGKHHPLSALVNVYRTHSNKLVIGQRGDHLLETAHQRKIVFALANETLEIFNVGDTRSLLKRIGENAARLIRNPADRRLAAIAEACSTIETIERDKLTEVISDAHIPLDDKELTKAERAVLQAVRKGNDTLCWTMYAIDQNKTRRLRKIHAGRSETADGWTDANEHIWIERKMLKLAKNGFAGFYQLVLLLVHEYLHESSDAGTHTHDHAFYEAFHDHASNIEIDPVGRAARTMIRTFSYTLRQERKHPTGMMSHDEDYDAQLGEFKDRLAITPVSEDEIFDEKDE